MVDHAALGARGVPRNGAGGWRIERPGAAKPGSGESLTVEEWFQKHRLQKGTEKLFERMVEHLQELNQEVFYTRISQLASAALV